MKALLQKVVYLEILVIALYLGFSYYINWEIERYIMNEIKNGAFGSSKELYDLVNGNVSDLGVLAYQGREYEDELNAKKSKELSLNIEKTSNTNKIDLLDSEIKNANNNMGTLLKSFKEDLKPYMPKADIDAIIELISSDEAKALASTDKELGNWYKIANKAFADYTITKQNEIASNKLQMIEDYKSTLTSDEKKKLNDMELGSSWFGGTKKGNGTIGEIDLLLGDIRNDTNIYGGAAFDALSESDIKNLLSIPRGIEFIEKVRSANSLSSISNTFKEYNDVVGKLGSNVGKGLFDKIAFIADQRATYFKQFQNEHGASSGDLGELTQVKYRKKIGTNKFADRYLGYTVMPLTMDRISSLSKQRQEIAKRNVDLVNELSKLNK